MNNILSHNPVLPQALRWPLKLIPDAMRHRLFCYSLNHVFKQSLLDDELAFLDGRSIAIIVEDANLRLCFGMRDNKLISRETIKVADMTMQGRAYDFLLMLSRKEDPDTLFFNRRLKLSGDTELGLYVKNFLDSLEFTDRQKLILTISDHARHFAEKFG